MFAGAIRSNLDPFGEYKDAELTRALNLCMLPALAANLDAPVAYMGSNFSLGQQQLLCLARALLNKSRLLLLDEATAALDLDTDSLVQHVLRTQFADRTVITIAHRLETIIDSDRVLVMDAGRVAEFDSPSKLLARPDSIFKHLCLQTGPAQYRSLCEAATRHDNTMRQLRDLVAAADSLGGMPAAMRAAALAKSVVHA